MASKRRGIPEINAGSMADIAFLLLIFFLVTTTMDVDKGLNRKLPPIEDEPQDQNDKIKQKNIFMVVINANDALLVEEEYMDLDELREAAKRFIDNNGDGSCEFCQGDQDPKSSDNPAKAIISVSNDGGTSYKMYVTVTNELIAAYNELREELSQRQFGKSVSDLDEDQAKFVGDVYPQIISEAEPVNLGS